MRQVVHNQRWMYVAVTLVWVLLLTACGGWLPANPLAVWVETNSSPTPSLTPAATVTPFLPLPTATSTPAPTATPTLLPSPTLQPTATWVWNPRGGVTAPILLYHHIGENDDNSRYYVSPAAFEQQMEWLHRHGYTTVTISTLVDALIDGGELPPRPVVITFDDGNESVYTHAFPIMERYGFVGTLYLVANRLDRNKFVNREQMRTMLDAGWEIGSHSLTHADLTQETSVLRSEVWESGQILSEAFDTPVTSFAYPFGAINPFVVERTERYGYRAAVGLGTSFHHDLSNLFYLARIEIRNEYDLNRFTSLLPWQSAVGE